MIPFRSDDGPGRVALAGEGQQVAHDLGGAFRLAADDLDPPLRVGIDRPGRQTLRPGQNRRQRVVQLVCYAGYGLTQRRHLLRLQQLLAEVAALVLQLSSFADVAHERVETGPIRAVPRVQGGRDLDPDRAVVGAAEPQKVIADRPVTAELGDERLTRLWIDEPVGCERSKGVVRLLGGKAEHQSQVGIGAKRGTVVRVECPDIHPLPDRVVEAIE